MLAAAGSLWVAVRGSAPVAPSQVFTEEGEPLCPALTDPLSVASLEMITYNEATASATPFKVVRKNGRWVLASHREYPAEANTRVAQAAAWLVDVKKGPVRSDRVADHETLGVIDPLEESAAGFRGRGKRVTFRGAHDEVLADVVIGKPVERQRDMYFVRVAGQKRTYAVTIKGELSSHFQDWVEPELLQVTPAEIVRVVWNRYHVDEQSGSVSSATAFTLSRSGDNKPWKVEGGEPAGEGEKPGESSSSASLKMDAVDHVLSAIAGLKMVEVSPKPQALAQGLKQSGTLKINMNTLLALQQKGFFVNQEGRLLSNEGEIQITTKDGVLYTVGFGEVATVGEKRGASTSKGGSGALEHRYVMVSINFDRATGPQEASSQGETRAKVKRLTERYADWFYVISGESYQAVQIEKAVLLKR